jgi:hypothetical protein
VAVAVPQKVDLLNPMELKRYRALQEIGKGLGDGGPGSVGEHRVRITRARFSEVQARVRRDVEAFGQTSNFIFFINHQPQKAQDLNTILTEMFERHYWKFPKVKAERINGRSTTNALIESCIVNPEYIFPSDTSEVARQARDTLQVLGLCSWGKSSGGKYEVKLKEPEAGSEGYEIWRIVLDTLTGDSTSPFATLYKRLSEVPYGLPDYMVELYVAAAKALKKVYILDKGGTMPPVGKKLVADITRRKDSDYRVSSVQETAVPYTYICSVWQAIDEPLGLRNYQDLEKSLGRTIDDQKIWFDLKADSNNLLLNRLGQIKENLRVLEIESRHFAILVTHLEQIRRIFVPAQGFEQLASLGEALSGRKVSDDPDTAALLVRRTIEDSECFLEDWQKLQSASRHYKQLRHVAELERFGDLARSAEESWQTYRSDALSTEKRGVFVAQFELLWSRYAEQYVDEHNAIARARAGYGKEVESSLAYELVGEFSHFDFSGVATKASFDARIKQVRHQSCQPLAEDSVNDYQQFGRVTCSCNYRLGSDTGILTQLQASEASLVTAVRNALDSYLTSLNDSLSSDSTQVYTQEKASAEEKAVIASAQSLTEQEHPLSDNQYRTLKALLPKLRSILEQVERYVKEQARKRKELEEKLQEEERQRRIPRLPTAQLSDTVRTFLLDSGLEAMTLKELEERLFLWLQEIAEEFKRRS